MIKNIENLTMEDKLFMLKNKKCFSMSTKSSITMNREEWESEIEREYTPDDIMKSENLEKDVKSRIFSYVQNINKIDIKNFVDELMNGIILETTESIVDFLIYCRNHIYSWQKNKKISPEEIGNLYKMLYSEYIPYKIRANSIYEKTSQNIKASDDTLNSFLYNIKASLFSQVSTFQDSNTSAMVIYLLMNALGLTEKNENVLDFFLLGKKYLNHEDISKIKPTVLKLLNGKSDALNIIDKISYSDIGENSSKLLDFAKRSMEKNYVKSKISDEIHGSSLCIGEDIFPDHAPMRLDDLLMELDKLTEEEIKNYIGEEKMISYSLSENDIGYLKKGESLPICKVLRKNDNFYTITKIDNESYLLFKVLNSDQIFGISFPPSNGGRRKLMTLSVPKKITYTMAI